MTSRRILMPDSHIPWPPNNIFPGKDITPDIDVKELVRAWLLPPQYTFEGLRWVPNLHMSPPDARGFKIEWFWEGQSVALSADGAYYLPMITGSYSRGLQAKITNPDGDIFYTDPLPMVVIDFAIVNETPIPVINKSQPEKLQLKPIIDGFGTPFPVPGLVVKFTPRNPAQATIDSSGVVTLLQDVSQEIIIDVEADFAGARYVNEWTITQNVYKPLTGLNFSPALFTDLRVDFSVGMNLNVTPADTTERDLIQYTSNPPGYVLLQPAPIGPNYMAIGLKESATPVTVTATAKGFSSVFTFPTIKPKFVAVTGIQLNAPVTPPGGYRVGDKIRLTATTIPANASNQQAFWTNSNSSAVQMTLNAPSGLIADLEFLQTGSGATISVRGQGGPTVTFETGQISPKPLPPPLIDLKAETLDSRVTYNGGEVAYIDANNMLAWSPVDVWPLQMKDGVVLGRALPEAGNINRITKIHFEGATPTNQVGSDSWRYTTSATLVWGATDGVDGGRAVGVPLWYNAARVVQDDVIIRALTSAFDSFYTLYVKDGLTVQRGVMRFTVPSPAATETRVDAVTNGNGIDFLTYSYKELEPGEYSYSFFRRRNANNDRWVYSYPQIHKGAAGVGPIKGLVQPDAKIVVQSNADVQTLRIFFVSPADGSFLTRDVQTGGATEVTIRATITTHWWVWIATRIEYIIP